MGHCPCDCLASVAPVTGERWVAEAGKTPGKLTSPDGAPPHPSPTSRLLLSELASTGLVAEMVSFVSGECGSETGYKRRRTAGASPPTDALTPVQQRQTARHRKQTLMSKLSDSGFEEDLGCSPVLSPARIHVSPLRTASSDEPPAGQPSTWYLQYGDIGYKIQREKEAQFHPCKSLARQPQVGYLYNVRPGRWNMKHENMYFINFCMNFSARSFAYCLTSRYIILSSKIICPLIANNISEKFSNTLHWFIINCGTYYSNREDLFITNSIQYIITVYLSLLLHMLSLKFMNSCGSMALIYLWNLNC